MTERPGASPLVLEVIHSGEDVVVKCSGRLVAGVGQYLYTKVSPLIPGSKRIVLDLTDLTHMDSMGLGTVVRLYVSAKSAGCDLRLINLTPRIRQLLSITNLLDLVGSVGGTGIGYL